MRRLSRARKVKLQNLKQLALWSIGTVQAGRMLGKDDVLMFGFEFESQLGVNTRRGILGWLKGFTCFDCIAM